MRIWRYYSYQEVLTTTSKRLVIFPLSLVTYIIWAAYAEYVPGASDDTKTQVSILITTKLLATVATWLSLNKEPALPNFSIIKSFVSESIG